MHRESEVVHFHDFPFLFSFSRAIQRVPLYPGFPFHSSLLPISARIPSIPTTDKSLREFFSECVEGGRSGDRRRRERAGRWWWTMGHSELIHLRFCRLPVKLPSRSLVLRMWLTCLEERIVICSWVSEAGKTSSISILSYFMGFGCLFFLMSLDRFPRESRSEFS